MPDIKRRDTSKKKKAILDGATQVFIELGYEVASMDKIAEVAGVSKKTVYNHFQSKENLFQAIVADFLSLRDQMKTVEYNPDLSIESQLRSFIDAELYLIDTPERRGLSKMLTSVFIMDIEFAYKTRSQYDHPHLAFIKWLELAKADKQLEFDEASIVAQLFYGMVEGCLTWNALFSNGMNLLNAEPIINELIQTFLLRYKRTDI